MPVYTKENPQAGFCPYCMSKVQPGEACKNCSLKQGSYIPSPHHIPPGTILMDRYLIGRVLGEGGFGITYIGCDLRLESKVAIKEYFPVDQVSRYADNSLTVITRTGKSQDSYSQGIQRFLREARSLARMEKLSTVVAAKDFFEANNTAYIVMEYIQGTDLKTLVAQRGGKLSAQELFPMIEPLFSALDAVHQAGLIHRDISPDNIMLEKGRVRLLDFGCARESIKGTETMTVALKQGYAPVEQYQRKGQGPWTDVYALAAVIYFCLTGKVPPASLDRILEDELVPPRQLGANITREQEAALLRALSLSTKRRYQSVATFYEALYHAPPADDNDDEDPKHIDDDIGHTDDIDIPAPKPEKNTRKLAIAAGAAAVVLLAIGIAAMGGKDDAIPPTPTQAAETVQGSRPPVSEAVGEVRDVEVSDESGFLAALDDDAVRSITIPTGSFVDLIAQTTVNLTKPLYISDGASVNMAGLMTVGPGGQVEISSGGSLELGLGVLRTSEGGGVTVKSGGHLAAWQCLVDQEGDLICEDGADIDIYGVDSLDSAAGIFYHVLPSEDLFADGVRVSTWAELEQAVNSGAASITVASGSEIVLEDWLTLSVPLFIEKDAQIVIEDDHRLELEYSVLVNRGTIRTSNRTENGEALQGIRNYRIFNFGAIDGAIRLKNDGVGYFLNLGELNCTTAAVFCEYFINLGAVNCYGAESRYFDFQGASTWNYGTWNAESDRAVETHVNLVSDFVNCGSMTIGANVQLANERQLWNHSGSITVTQDAMPLANAGVIRNSREGSYISLPHGDALEGCGLLEYHEGTLSLYDGLRDHGNRLLCLSETYGYIHDEGDLEAVGNAFLGNRLTYIDGDLELSGDWTITAPIVVYGSITVDGSLTVDGSSGGFLICEEIHAPALTITNSGTVFASSEGHISEGLYLLSGGSRLYLGNCESHIQGALSIQEHSDMIAIGSVYINNADVSLTYSNYLFFNGGYVEIADCSVTVSQSSRIWLKYCDFNLRNSQLTNHGGIDACGNYWYRTVTLNGSISNYGTMNLNTDSNIVIGGTLHNYGELYTRRARDGGLIVTGTLKNDGNLYNHVDEGISLDLVTQGGQVSGNPPIAP